MMAPKKKIARGLLLLTTVLATTIVGACGNTNNASKNAADAGTGTASGSAAVASQRSHADWPKELNFGILPGDSQQGSINDLMKQFASDLSKDIGIPVNTFVGEDYTAIIEAMRAKKVDLAVYGSFEYIIAHDRSNAMPIAVAAAGKDNAFYKSSFIVPADSPAQSVKDLKGKNFLFVDPASTSGNLFPRAYLIDKLGVNADNLDSYFGNVTFSGGHDKSVLAIAHGDADGAAVGDVVVDQMVKGGVIKKDDVRVLEQTDPIPLGPLSYRGDLPADLVEKIKDFALNYDKVNPDYFKQQNYTAYYPVTDEEFNTVRDTATELHLSPDDLLK